MSKMPGACPAWLPWAGFAALLVLAPLAVDSRLALNLMSQMAIAAILCLSYWLLMGQGGLLSFGHAVYSGMGAFFGIHALRWVEAGASLPVSLVPLVGGVAALAVALPLGWMATRSSSTAFAMITLGLGELAWAVSLMFPGFFGGEQGISANRTAGPAPWGISFGPPVQLYYLIAAYAFASALAIYAFTRTPLGRLLNAVRDNAERVSFLGHDPRRVRWLAFLVAAFFAGVSGGLGALLHEIVTTEVLSSQRSAVVLVFTFLGGVGFFLGPLIGAVLMVLGMVMLSGWTSGWLLYLGLLFLVMVVFAPTGLAGWLQATRSGAVPRASRQAMLFLVAAPGLVGLVALVEMAYQLRLADTLGAERAFLGLVLDAHAPVHWLVAGLVASGSALATAWLFNRLKAAGAQS